MVNNDETATPRRGPTHLTTGELLTQMALSGSEAWYQGNLPSQEGNKWVEGQCPLPVGTKAANELGLYHMSGNVLERVSDRASYTYPSEPP